MTQELSNPITKSIRLPTGPTVSACDILKNNTSEVIKKLESSAPSLIQNYSDLYNAYLHMFDDLYKTCYGSEKEFFEKLNIDPKILRQIQENSEFIKNGFIRNIDMASKFFNESVKMRISAIQSFDKYFHVTMDAYSKMWSQFNSVH